MELASRLISFFVLLIPIFPVSTYELNCEGKTCTLEEFTVSMIIFSVNLTAQNPAFQNATSLTVKNTKFLAIPMSLLANMKNIEKFEAEGCGIILVTVFSMAYQQNLKNLKSLHLANNRIITLRSFVFAGAKQLRVLRLTNNPIAVIEKWAFQGLGQLEEIYLNKCKVQILDWSVFAPAVALKTIDLQDGKITNVWAGSNQPQVTLLNLANNKLKDCKEISEVTSLSELVLTGNDELTLDLTEFFAPLSNLEILHLGKLLATEIDFNQFPVMPNLQMIWLDWNNIETLKGYENARKKFPKLQKLDVGHNRFQCKYLNTLMDTLKAMNITMESFYQQPGEGTHYNETPCTENGEPETATVKDYEDPATEQDGSAKELNKMIATLERRLQVLEKGTVTPKDLNHDSHQPLIDALDSKLTAHAMVLTFFGLIMGTLMIVGAVVFMKAKRNVGSQHRGSVHMLIDQN